MSFKINIATKEGKTFRLETEGEDLAGKKIHDKVSGNEISPDLEGYEFEIAGASDKAGFPHSESVEGSALSRVLLKYGFGFNRRPKKEGKKKRSKNRPKGLRLRKSVRGNTISSDTSQINLKIIKEGNKKLSEVFPDQNKAPESENTEAPTQEQASGQTQAA